MASSTYVHPDRYSANFFFEWAIVPAVHPLKPFVECIEKLHPELALRGKENAWLWPPIFLIIAAYVPFLRHHHPGILLRE